MKLLSKTILLSIVLALISFLPKSAMACSCRKFTPCEVFSYASVVFIGRVIDGRVRMEKRKVEGKQVSTVDGWVKFSIEEVFKGVTTTQLEIGWDTGCIDDGLILGERYLIYAREHSSRLYSDPCLRSTLVKSADEDISFLRNLPAPGIGGRIYGIVAVDSRGPEPPPLAGVTVVVVNELQERFETVTDSKGHYEITGLKPGNYIIEPSLPEHYVVYSPKREVTVSDRGCTTTIYWVKVDSSIIGKVVDSSGRPAPASLYLVSVNEQYMNPGSSYNNGEFEITGIRPGRYLLYVKLKDEPGRNEDEELFFYPGVFDKSKAGIIEVSLGQKQTIPSFQLPPQIKVHTVSGTVMYADGKPAAKVRLLIFGTEENKGKYQTAYWLPQVETDAEGRFVLQGFKGNTYSIEARDDWNGERRQLYSEPLKFTLDKDIDNLNLVLSLTEPPEDRRAPQKKAPEEKRQ